MNKNYRGVIQWNFVSKNFKGIVETFLLSRYTFSRGLHYQCFDELNSFNQVMHFMIKNLFSIKQTFLLCYQDTHLVEVGIINFLMI